ncbi:MAG TPA: hypothetical protein VGL75_04295 [Acidothermaceae bacterium]
MCRSKIERSSTVSTPPLEPVVANFADSLRTLKVAASWLVYATDHGVSVNAAGVELPAQSAAIVSAYEEYAQT